MTFDRPLSPFDVGFKKPMTNFPCHRFDLMMNRRTKPTSWILLTSLVMTAGISGCIPTLSRAPVDVDLQELGINEIDAAERDVVVLKFGANWCPPCRKIDKELDRLRQTHGGSVIVKTIDIDHDRSLGQKFGVSSIPRVFLIKDGKRIDDVVGYRSHDDLAAWVEDAGARPGGHVVINTMENTSAKPTPVRPSPSGTHSPGAIQQNPFL